MEPSNGSELFLRAANENGIRSNLSVRQLQIAKLASSGYSNREIAFELKISEQIVKNALHTVFDKLGVWNRVELTNRLRNSAGFRIVAGSAPRPKSEYLEQSLRCEASPSNAGHVLAEIDKDAESGMDLRDLLTDPAFRFRKKRRPDGCAAAEAYQSLARVFAENPDIVLQRLVETATSSCGADSAGISLEEAGNDERRFRWIAISGSFAAFVGGTTPRFFSPCGTTLDRDRAQLYRVGKPYYDLLGIKADPITDGILIPWRAGKTRGTIWMVSHRHQEAFDVADFKLMDGLADFAALAVKNRLHQCESEKMEKSPAS